MLAVTLRGSGACVRCSWQPMLLQPRPVPPVFPPVPSPTTTSPAIASVFLSDVYRGLEEQIAVGRHLKVGRAIGGDGHDAVQHGDPDVRVPGHRQVPAEPVRSAVFASRCIDFGRPRFRHLLEHP